MNYTYFKQFLEEHNVPTITKKKHSFLTYYGLEQEDTYILKDGVVKISIILHDGREFNISYMTPFDIISLVRDEVSQYTSAPFNVRVESEIATFYRLSTVVFWDYIKKDRQLTLFVNSYYKQELSQALHRQQVLTMNGKNGAVCSFIYDLIPIFGKETPNGILIDLTITNDDIAGFCGISTRNSVNRILRRLREKEVISIVNHKILIKDKEYLEKYVQI
jgi:CRP-like cAMP-binding protein